MSDDGKSSNGDSSAPSKPESSKPSKPSEDVVVLGPPTSDGQGVHVLRARNEQLEAGELRTLRDGQPIVGEILSLEPRKDQPRVCDVRESWPATRQASPSHKGPARVATTAYRAGWDEIFGPAKRKTDRFDMN
ncbi:MAG: hypothetical protein FWD69_01855 [Polyangiaceae bacterium]|nr:hypothetical protein [Polyangiaceae bacterium]